MPVVQMDYPPGTNRLWSHVRGRTVLSKEARDWINHSAWQARAAGVSPIDGPVGIRITLHPRITAKGKASKVRLDVDGPIKITLDALEGVAYANDKQVTDLQARIGAPMADGGLTVEVNAL